MSTITVSLPDDLRERAAAQAKAMGLSLDQYVAIAVAARVGAQSETERAFAVRAARAVPGRARGILARLGQGNPPIPGDEFLEERAPE